LRLLPVVLALAASAAFVAAAPAGAQTCPRQSFLEYGHLVYASVSVPGSARLGRGAPVGAGLLDSPTDDTGCRRRRDDVTVVRLAGVEPGAAVAVDGRTGVAFVLGARCSGYARAELWDCLRTPLRLGAVDYVGVRYPGSAAGLPLGEPVGPAMLGDTPVQAVTLEGVDPAVAVGAEGHPGEAFVAPGVCPYERFSAAPTLDDLRRCLTGPVWLVFDPPGGRVGTSIVARPDRPMAAPLAGATVTLQRLRIGADVVPRNPTATAPIGAVRAGPLSFEIPDVEPGLYEAVVGCDGCAAAFGGRTEFPAGARLVGPKESKGSSAPRIIAIALGLVVLALGVAAVVVYRRSRRPPSGPAPAGP
jgi:hypothetical protein